MLHMTLGLTRVRSHLAELFGEHAHGFDRVLEDVQARLADVVLPERHESASVALATPKTAALVYDRVWGGLRYDIPADVTFHGNSESELEFLAFAQVFNFLKELSEEDDPIVQANAGAMRREFATRWQDLYGPSAHHEAARILAAGISASHAVGVTSVYASVDALDREYAPGNYEVIVATLSALDIPIEAALTWEQVAEFRRDKGSRQKLRRFVHWLDKDMAGRSAAFLADEISGRLEDYRAALRKHGISVALGSLASIIDSKAVIGGAAAVASLSYAADQRWALLGGGAIMLASGALHVGRALLELRDVHESAKEIAFVAALEDASGRSK